ncbi:MAG: class I SAM-dependent methyltransferase [Bacteroidia bacterium]|nr:class I SAM-dependent methyltransferase [Bacteroidia bacterium]MDW8346338.1 class I SAM-dependent methyltransferase [Bacteroidia bacterium]
MQYDPIKKSLGNFFNKTPFLRKVFYRILNVLLLRAWHIYKHIRRWSKDKKNLPIHILDAGSGFGQYTYTLSKMSDLWQITAVDVKIEQIHDCNLFFQKIGKGDRVKFYVEDLVTYQRPHAYDAILSIDVMEHILEDEVVFRNFGTSLKKHGVLFISTPSDQGGSDVHHEGDNSFIEEHVRDGYSKEEITQKLLKAGFSKVEVKYSYGKYGSLSWRLSMKYPISWIGKSRWFFVVLPFYYLVIFPVCLVLNWIDVKRENSRGTGLIVLAYK